MLNNVVFCVKYYYEKLKGGGCFPYRLFWISQMSKVCFFTWLAIRGVILPAENLLKR